MSNSSENSMRVKLSDPRMPEAALLFLPGLGSFENQRVREVTQAEVELYERRTQRSFMQVIDAHPFLRFVEEPLPPETRGTVLEEPVVEVEEEQSATDEETPSPRRRRRGDAE